MDGYGVGGPFPAYSFEDCNTYAGSQFASRGLHSGVFFGNSHISLSDMYDGTSNTYLFAERGIVDGWGKWGGAGEIMKCPFGISDVTLPGVLNELTGGGLRIPRHRDSDRLFLWSWHDGVSGVALGDGSVKFLTYSTSYQIQAAYTTRNGGEVDSVHGF